MARSIARCHACRHNILNTFAALANISIRPAPNPSSLLRSRGTVTSLSSRCHNGRTFASSSRLFQAQDQSTTPLSEPQPDAPPKETTTTDPSIPWYLQVEIPQPPAPSQQVSPHLALQEIPPIPIDAPPILSPMLNHLSTQIGLDNLSLIDLRDLDPPPALGANLLMIIGTARSYKHLNTAADRFCRWLRSRYKLHPYADGLLGRNELKLKLRRKARKMKLAQSVGNTTAMNEVDDGITTGWVCVNVGTVDNAKIPEGETVEGEEVDEVSRHQQEEIENEEEEYENPDDAGNDSYVGFGSRSNAPRIVVQMFIEEKRVEVDLEGLWDHRQERRAQRAEKEETEAKQAVHSAIDSSDSMAAFKPWT